jgi:hypothetical protein
MHRLRLPSKKQGKTDPVDLNIVDFANRDFSFSSLFRENKVYDSKGKVTFLPPLITDDFNTFTNFSYSLRNELDCFVSSCVADPLRFTCASSGFNRFMTSLTSSPMHKKALMGSTFKPRQEILVGRVGRDQTSFFELDTSKSMK